MESPTVNGWTRAKNDQISTTYDASRQVELFKYIVYSPDYLQEGSCSSGNSANCNVYRSQDIANEPRIGKLSNLNEIQCSFTNAQALGIKTSPDFSSGKPFDDDMFEQHKLLEPIHTYTSRVTDIAPDTLMNQRFMDDPRAPSRFQCYSTGMKFACLPELEDGMSLHNLAPSSRSACTSYRHMPVGC